MMGPHDQALITKEKKGKGLVVGHASSPFPSTIKKRKREIMWMGMDGTRIISYVFLKSRIQENINMRF